MNAEAVRRVLANDDLDRVIAAQDEAALVSAMRAVVDRLADRERFFEAGSADRERIAQRAAVFLDDRSAADDAVMRLRHARGEWRERARAAEALLRSGNWTSARLLGSLAPRHPRTPPRSHEGADVAVASAMVIALREAVTPDFAARQETLRREGGVSFWQKKWHELLGHVAGNARAQGATREGAALSAMAAAAILEGEALCANDAHRALALTLGAGASCLLRRERAAERTTALSALTAALAEQNDVRLRFWDGYDADDVRLLGAAATAAALGRGGVTAPVPGRVGQPTIAFRLPEQWHERFSHVAASDAAEALERRSHDPRASEAERLMAEALAETLAAHPHAETVSFAEALGIEAAPLRTDDLRAGEPLFRAVTRARHPMFIVCSGKRGRALRCRAVANTEGALVGYRAFDPLSRELGKKPLYALYDLEGRRVGYAWADRQAVACFGAPEQGFASAPASLDF
ncbi:MAG: hypothetical protein QY323_02870 [Patescibacteria group bacterium]|nr:MAG: hypothetical protein QY323_02870 [Patescibacteria group bacterium]